LAGFFAFGPWVVPSPRKEDGMAANVDWEGLLERYSLCGRCLWLFERDNPEGFTQRCRCEPDSDDTWPGFDFNQRVELCRCCLISLVQTGHRFSPWYCPGQRGCFRRAFEFNREVGDGTIPLGRHSFQAGLALSGSVAVRTAHDPVARQIADQFSRDVLELLARQDRVESWREARLREILHVTGLAEEPEIRLRAFEQAIQEAIGRDAEAFSRAKAFRGMVEQVLGVPPKP
jgi:hypothetical protein